MKKIVCLVAMMVTMVLSLHAQEAKNAPRVNRVPAYPGLIERTQPNGDTLHTYLRGDERKHWMMTEDGWRINENKKGWLKYVKKTRKGEYVLSCRKAHNAEDRKRCEKRWLERHGVKELIRLPE